jgi:hypothetical protein
LIQEHKFRDIIKLHIKRLLTMKKEYWKQRFTNHLVQFGDENTKFFHGMAFERYKHNVISQIVDSTSRMVSDHEEMSALFSKNLGEGLVIKLMPP